MKERLHPKATAKKKGRMRPCLAISVLGVLLFPKGPTHPHRSRNRQAGRGAYGSAAYYQQQFSLPTGKVSMCHYQTLWD
ncbi:MAG: hypothetical protein ACOZF2_10850 [Thermodesulfobacteriota bacterium]